MISSWRKRRAARRAAKELHGGEGGEMELKIPNHFRCPISMELMKDPVTLSTGITYDRESIEKWIETGKVTCPITNVVLTSLEPIPNHTIRKMVQDWCVENRSYGVERIPTPKTPVTSMDVWDMLSKVTTAYKKEDRVRCRDLVVKIKGWVKESERNKRCIVANGTGSVLSAAFESFSKTCFDENVAVLEEILSALTLVFPLDGKATSYLGSASSLQCLVWFLKSGDLSRRRNAALVLKEFVSEQKEVNVLSELEGAMEALFKLVKEPICPTSTKASLIVIYYMVTSSSPTNDKIVAKFVEMELVILLLEMLVDAQKSICEKALGVLDGIFSCDSAREQAYNNALTMPVIVKKILRVSDVATELAVSILWKLCKNENREEKFALVEALQLGAFQKLLVLLQVGCAETTKEKVTELLKLLNLHRDRLECIDSMDFKELKRPF